MSKLELKGISKSFGSSLIVNNLDLEIQDGEFLTILGPSGCGKTTTLRMIAGFETPDKGQVLLNNQDISQLPPYKRNVNTVFQNYALFPHLNVEENIAFGLHQKKLSKSETNKRVDEMLELVQMEAFKTRKPFEMSGGQQQRVAIARAIAPDPEILLLDEPLGALDLKLRKQMQFELKQLHKDLNKTFVYVTHDQEEALTMSDRIAVMNQGIIEQLSDSQTLYNLPKTKFVAGFIGEANLILVQIENQKSFSFEAKTYEFEHKNIDKQGVLFIRPENVSFDAISEIAMKVTIEDVIFVGNHRKYKLVTASGQKIIKTEDSSVALTKIIGQSVTIYLSPNLIQIYNS
ncbi:ABC transporter ATP-binding protein [Flavobacterium restrictum]|uniref:Spermidine/putrescine import ATP-binding protein PotA n=1 Tax=Flavobacterium restrictum TaxID=2594428 RepID=A0A553E8K3_9FLAO|nr:ABC transporter ATP-binding protein [Flavobacterium restrictum]TRX41320.1 ABC transporter ATP-binding protein [Flavobacterium restrictum]